MKNSTSKPRTKWERMVLEDYPESVDIWYERAGKYQYSAGMPEEDADRRAFMELVRYER